MGSVSKPKTVCRVTPATISPPPLTLTDTSRLDVPSHQAALRELVRALARADADALYDRMKRSTDDQTSSNLRPL